MSICFCGYLKALIILIWISDVTNSEKVQGRLPDPSVISSLFSMLIKPYLQTQHFERPNFRASAETAIEKIVRLKILELKPFLQDYDFNTPEVDDLLTLEGKDETTIVEFLPKTGAKKTDLRESNDPFKAKISKYKKIRNKINKALHTESVSDKTKTLITNTLDELIRRMIETRCNWKGGSNVGTLGIHGNDNTLIVPRGVVNMWSHQWKEFKTKFADFINHRSWQQRDGSRNVENLIEYLNHINILLNDVSDNFETFAQRYSISCYVQRRKRLNNTNISSTNSPDALRNFKLSYDTDNEKNVCNNFHVCSKELKSFLMELYNSVNDSVVNVIRNYGEMFTRDVHTDVSNEKDNVVSTIFKISNVAESGIVKVYANDTTALNLDIRKNKEANVKILTDYIKKVMKDVKEQVSRILVSELNSLNDKISSSIRQDVAVNLGVDLGNLERDTIAKICFVFNVCNGKTNGRRFNVLERDNNGNKIYVKVELTLDDENNDTLSNKLLNNTELGTNKLNQTNVNVSNDERGSTRFSDYQKYGTIIVTRTTPFN